MKTIFNFSHPLGEKAKEQITAEVGENKVCNISVHLDLHEKLHPQMLKICHQAVTDHGQSAKAGHPRKIPFRGEKMACVLCERAEISDPSVESGSTGARRHGWRSIDLDDARFYICPDEFPDDRMGTVQDFKLAYELALAAALLKSIKNPPQHLLDQIQALRDSAPWRHHANSD
jgi:hypothetical protein